MLGSGAFACEAMEAAIASNAKHVTMVCRERKRYVCFPFMCCSLVLGHTTNNRVSQGMLSCLHACSHFYGTPLPDDCHAESSEA